MGNNSNITPGVANSIILGNAAAVSSPNSLALGNQTAVSGLYATAIGYQANTSQDYAIVLGTTNTNSNVGIGTTIPDEKLHVVGNIKMVDGNQADGNILKSDANGKSSWETITSLNTRLNKYGEIYRNSTASLSNENDVYFDSNGPSNGVTLSVTNIKVSTTGDYKITYSINFTKNNLGLSNSTFCLRKNGTKIDGSTLLKSFVPTEIISLTKTKIVTLNANDIITVFYDNGDNISILERTSLSVELIK